MFLVTTANQKFWDLDEPILFLGEWCRIYSHKKIWSKLPHEVIPYHGQDRKRLYNDYKYAMAIYESLLIQLTSELNKLHGSKHATRYWRIVLGPWLSYFTVVLLDRYRSISAAENLKKVKNTWITPELPERSLSMDFSEFHTRASKEDDFNHCLFSQIIKLSKKIPWETKTTAILPNFKSINPPWSNKKSFQSVISSWLGNWPKLIPESFQEVVVDQSYIKPLDLMKLKVSMKMIPCSYRKFAKSPPLQPNWEMRKSINLPSLTNDGFELVLKKCIPSLIPKVYIEGYATMTQRALEVYPKRTKVILTSIAQKINEEFKLWAANQVEKGAKLVITQHGGHVGDGLWSVDDDHDISIADRYFSWGWTRRNESKVVPMPSSMLGNIGDCTPDYNGSVLCVTSSFSRYTGSMFAVPSGPMVLQTFKFEENFLQGVSSDVSKLLVFRLYKNCGWGKSLRWQDSKVSPQIYKGKRSYLSHLRVSRLCVCFYNGTPFIETFSKNYPTLLCWDPNYSELNELAQPYFDPLREAGILHYTSESAASKLNEIYQDPLSWWLSSKVQTAKNKFCDRFARVDKNWLGEWKKELLKLRKEKNKEDADS